jgi:23S rRNA (adenine2503-C2)-methyltransferase
MKKLIDVPTGKIGILDGDYGQIECLYVADYGKENNMHADFLGLSTNIQKVTGQLMPLKRKIVVTISTQYGCNSNCRFCDVPKVGAGRNCTIQDLGRQIAWMLVESEVRETDRLNIHFARMGEPTWNFNVIAFSRELIKFTNHLVAAKTVHPVVSTMLPSQNKHLLSFLSSWCDIKNNLLSGDAGLQLSINSTDGQQREWLFRGSALSLEEIAKIGEELPYPIGRQYTLNFAVFNKTVIDAHILSKLFNPKKFLVKLTPVHRAFEAVENHIYTPFWYKEHNDRLKAAGFNVIVFIPSEEEELSKITCGNALLSNLSS